MNELQLRLAVLLALNGNPPGAMVVLGIECSTFVSINRGTSWRDDLNPWGNPGAPSVQAANMSTSRQGCEAGNAQACMGEST